MLFFGGKNENENEAEERPSSLPTERRRHLTSVKLSLWWMLVPFIILVILLTGVFFTWRYAQVLSEQSLVGENMTTYALIGGSVASFVAFLFFLLLGNSHLKTLRRIREIDFQDEMYSLVIEGVGDGMWDWNLETGRIVVSNSWLDLFGYHQKGISPNPEEWFALVHPEDTSIVKQAIELHFSRRAVSFHVEHRMRTSGGEYKWVLNRGRAIFNAHHKPIRVAGSMTDVSRLHDVEEVIKAKTVELEQANESIRQEEVKYEALISSIGEGIIATDPDGRVVVMNQQAASMLERDLSLSMGAPFSEVIPLEENEKEEPVPVRDRALVKTLLDGARVTQIAYYFKKSGEKFPVNVTSSPIVLHNAIIGAIIVFRDITREREIDKSKTEFVSLASHQLRTPLSAIRWYSEMLLSQKLGVLTPDQQTYLDEIYQSNIRMIELVNSLLNVSRIDLGTFAIEPEETDVVEISESIIQELSVKIAEKEIQLEKYYEPEFPKVKVDPKLMRIIFQNLISNAVKYTLPKGSISVLVGVSGDYMRIAVKDTGCGIPKNVQDKIFTKLFRADNARAVESEGTGLGLYIIKAIVEKSNGRVWFESEENKGTTFFVEIPLSGMVSTLGTKGLS